LNKRLATTAVNFRETTCYQSSISTSIISLLDDPAMSDSRSVPGLKQRWNKLPNVLKFTISGASVGILANYATEGLNLAIRWLSGGPDSQLIQFTIIVFGIYLFFDTLHKARITRVESKIEDYFNP
jgi:hypothetical protein